MHENIEYFVADIVVVTTRLVIYSGRPMFTCFPCYHETFRRKVNGLYAGFPLISDHEPLSTTSCSFTLREITGNFCQLASFSVRFSNFSSQENLLISFENWKMIIADVCLQYLPFVTIYSVYKGRRNSCVSILWITIIIPNRYFYTFRF